MSNFKFCITFITNNQFIEHTATSLSFSYASSQLPDNPATSYSVTRFSKKLVWSAPFSTHSNQGRGFSFTLKLSVQHCCNNRLSVIYLIYAFTSDASRPSTFPSLYARSTNLSSNLTAIGHLVNALFKFIINYFRVFDTELTK